MANLQKANLGSAPAGSGGDDQRTANTKFNANVDVLSAQATLTTATPITTAQTLAASHVGKRVAINIAAGGTVKLPAAASCPADGVIHLRNVGKAVSLAVADGSGDSFALSRLNNGEGALIDTDGVKAWRVLTRGRAYGDDEIVNGALVVGGGLSVGGDVAVSGRVQGANSANLLKNGSGEFGNVGWQAANFGAAVYAGGDTAFTNAAALANVSVSDQSDAIPVVAGTPITFSGEIRTPGMSAGLAELFCNFYNAGGSLLASIDLDSRIAAGTVDWVAVRKSTTAPANSASMRVGKYASLATAVANGIAFRRIKVEVGAAPSLYSQEGSIAYLGGAPALGGRPTFGGKVPWDSGNLPNPVQVSQLAGARVTTSTTVPDTPYSGPGAFANMWSYSFAHTGLSGTALISFFGGISVAGTSSNLTVGYSFKLIDTVTNTALDESTCYQDLLSVIGNWSNFYRVNVAIAATGLVVGRTYTIQVAGFKTANVGPIGLALNIRGVTH
ncbi:hypothetical protein [Burkholderia cepacia]|uniref:Uncharacterized protein n=1 Tax=Burkholderia cepacia GG4 TaxID=1009846 RepID=A0A9W3PBE1_BURCE|nr:hypothetical protein [Burkholderia cepacia]AFQ50451.1 hypothetical protein GEM_4061 [Burkholderia cepacia GG4]